MTLKYEYNYQKLQSQKEKKQPLYSVAKVTMIIILLVLGLLTICIVFYSAPYVKNSVHRPTLKIGLKMPRKQVSLKSKIAIVVVYGGGKLPKYSKKFLDSVKNKEMDVLFVSMDGSPLLDTQYKNIKQISLATDFYSFTTGRLCKAYGGCSSNEQIKLRFLIQKRLQKPFLICELRPLYSFIFAEYLKEYEYVGWGDIDTVWGDVSILTQYLQYDIVTVAFSDMNRLYLRGQFTIFRNILNLTLSFTKAISMVNFIKALKSKTMLPEEGMFSKYMISSNYSIIILPFQRSSWDCRDNIIRNGNIIECDKAEKFPKISNIPVGPAQEKMIVTKENSDDCSTNWIIKEYRTCIKAVSFGFLTIKSNVVYSHPISSEQHKSIARFPLFYHFQLEKGHFEFKDVSLKSK